MYRGSAWLVGWLDWTGSVGWLVGWLAKRGRVHSPHLYLFFFFSFFFLPLLCHHKSHVTHPCCPATARPSFFPMSIPEREMRTWNHSKKASGARLFSSHIYMFIRTYGVYVCTICMDTYV